MRPEDLQRAYSGSPFEAQVGFCRAIRAGEIIYTAGTLAADEQGTIHGESCYEQCCYIFEKLERALAALGSSLARVIRVTAYLIDINDSRDFARAHQEFLGAARPAATAVQVSGLFVAEARIEIELIALA